MTRAPDPAKKPALLEQIVDHFLDRSLSTLTFRGLATALGVSTFTLVYHFGNRRQLIREIIESIATRRRGFEVTGDLDDIDIDSYITGLRHTFDQALLPRNRALQRLEFEAQMLEALETEPGATRTAHDQLHELARRTLVALGVDDDDALVEGRLLIDTFYGIQVGLVITRDDAQATAAFERAIADHRARIETLSAQGASALSGSTRVP